VPIDLRKNEQKTPEYLRIHPYGLVPATEDNGIIMYESSMINEYFRRSLAADATAAEGSRPAHPRASPGGLS